METRSAAAAAASLGSSESVRSLSHSEDASSEYHPNEERTTTRKERPRHFKQKPGTFKKKLLLLPSPNDPDINAIFQCIMRSNDGYRVFKCLNCGKEFTSPYSARRHAGVYLKQKVTCGICSLSLTGPLSLALHHKEIHKVQKKVVTSGSKKDTERHKTSTKDTKPATPVTFTRNTRTSRDAAAAAAAAAAIDAASVCEVAATATANQTARDTAAAPAATSVAAASTNQLPAGSETPARNAPSGSAKAPDLASVSAKPPRAARDTAAAPAATSVAAASTNQLPAGSETPARKAPSGSAKAPDLASVSTKPRETDGVSTRTSSRMRTNDVIETIKKVAASIDLAAAQEKKMKEEEQTEASNFQLLAMSKKQLRRRMVDDEQKMEQERRSKRIQMRMAMEASAMEEEERRPRKLTPPPFYPSNTEKMREAREAKAQMQRRAQSLHSSVVRQQQQPLPVLQQDPSFDNLINEVLSSADFRRWNNVTRQSRPESTSASSSRETLVPSSVKAAAAASMAQQRQQQLMQPVAASSTYQSSPPHFVRSSTTIQRASPSSVMTPSPSPVAVACSPRESPHFCSGIGNFGYYSLRPSAVCGPIVHRQQPMVLAPSVSHYPARLSTALLNTIYHPEWLRHSWELGDDERNAISLYGHAHLMLSAKMHRMSTMLEKCLQGLVETSLPLPPQQVLMPSPCPLLDDGWCDPLKDVLGCLPRLPSHALLNPLPPVNIVCEPRYTIACAAARNTVWSKSEERKWWEVRTWPSFNSLAGPVRHLPVTFMPSVGPAHLNYTTADRMAGRDTMKYTYVTPKKPIFSVHESLPWSQSHPRVFPVNYSTSPTPSYSTTPLPTPGPSTSTFSANSGGIQFSRPPTRLSAGTERPRRPSNSRARQRKRPAEQQSTNDVATMVKRLKTSLLEPFPTQSTSAEELLQLQLQPLVVQTTPGLSCTLTEEKAMKFMQSVEEEADTDIVHLGDYYNGHAISQKEVVEENGSTFTVL